MLDKLNFKESLDALVEIAKAQNNILTMEEIKEHFKELGLSEEQFKLVFEFLMSSQITVKHFVAKEKAEDNSEVDKKKDTQEESHLAMYLDELKDVEQLSIDEMNTLALQCTTDNTQDKAKLIEGTLKFVIDLTEGFLYQGVSASDLIQEGNMALMLSTSEYINGKKEISYDKYITMCVERALKAAIDENYEETTNENQVLNKVNHLTDVTKELAEELEREATLEEIAARMKMPEEEVKDIMRISLEALGVEHSHNHDHEH